MFKNNTFFVIAKIEAGYANIRLLILASSSNCTDVETIKQFLSLNFLFFLNL